MAQNLVCRQITDSCIAEPLIQGTHGSMKIPHILFDKNPFAFKEKPQQMIKNPSGVKNLQYIS